MDFRRLGRELATLHASSPPAFGWTRSGYLGPLKLDNRPTETWVEFFGERRLRPLVQLAVGGQQLPVRDARLLEKLIDRLPRLLGGGVRPARLHGDLWSGNRLFDAEGLSWLVDPAPYGGDREVDLAMMKLFGGFPEVTFEAMDEVFPLESGWRDRIALYQVLPLLVHVVLFGHPYVAPLRAAVTRYL